MLTVCILCLLKSCFPLLFSKGGGVLPKHFEVYMYMCVGDGMFVTFVMEINVKSINRFNYFFEND